MMGAISGNQWQSVASPMDRKPRRSTPDDGRNQWHSVAIHRHQWQLVAISESRGDPHLMTGALSGTQWQSIAISGNQRPSAIHTMEE